MEKHFIPVAMFEKYATMWKEVRTVGKPYAPRPLSRLQYIYV